MANDISQVGPLLSNFSNFEGRYSGPKTLLAIYNQYELYHSPARAQNEDPEYLLVTNGDLNKCESAAIRFSRTGELISVDLLRENGSNTSENLILSTPKSQYDISRSALPFEANADNGRLSAEQVFEKYVNWVYELGMAVKSRGYNLQNSGDAKQLFEIFNPLTYAATKGRYDTTAEIIGGSDIIPDQSPLMSVIRLGDGCIMTCNFCSMRGSFQAYSTERVESETSQGRAGVEKYLGINARQINRIMYDISDIMWLLTGFKGNTNLTIEDVGRITGQHYDWITDRRAFAGSKSTLEVCADPNGEIEISRKHYSLAPLQRIRDAGIKRLYVGWETGHDVGSELLGKNISFEEKATAAKLMLAAGFDVFAIVQILALGKKFHPKTPYMDRKSIDSDRYIPFEVATKETARLINKVQPTAVQVSVSQDTTDVSLELKDKGYIVPPKNRLEQIVSERELLLGEIDPELKSRVIVDYQNFLATDLRIGQARFK